MKFFHACCVLWSLAVQVRALDREAFTFTNYSLEVRVEPEQQRLAVRGNITLRNDSATAQKNLSLQISSSLGWRSIQLDGKPVQFVSQPYASDIDHTGALSEALVTLPKEVPPKGTVDLEIGYEANTNRYAHGGGQAQRLGPDRQVVYRSARHRICSVVSSGDGGGESVGREQRVRDGCAMEGTGSPGVAEDQAKSFR